MSSVSVSSPDPTYVCHYYTCVGWEMRSYFHLCWYFIVLWNSIWFPVEKWAQCHLCQTFNFLLAKLRHKRAEQRCENDSSPPLESVCVCLTLVEMARGRIPHPRVVQLNGRAGNMWARCWCLCTRSRLKYCLWPNKGHDLNFYLCLICQRMNRRFLPELVQREGGVCLNSTWA